MSHIDDGALHAYLDGALDEYPATEGRDIRAHLEVCAACRERLEVERGVRTSAMSILGLAAPQVEVPSLEDLRAYARANPPAARQLPVRLRRVAWAASVLLALGMGWMLRGGPDVRDAGPILAVAPAPAAGLEADVVASTPPTEAPAARLLSGTVRVAETTATEDDATDADMDRVVGSLIADVGDREAVRAPVPSFEPGPVVAADVGTPVNDAAVARAVAPAPSRRSAPTRVVTSATTVAPLGGLIGRGADFGDAGDARRRTDEEFYSLAVPNLDVLELRYRGTGVRREGQVMLQRLESGDTLFVIHLPPEINPSRLEPRAPDQNELVVQRQSGSIVMRAPVSEGALMDLMARLLGEP
jgi:hypothetical protein